MLNQCTTVYDFKYCFTGAVIKWPGSVHDARIFHNCALKEILNDRTMPPLCHTLDTVSVPVCILDDLAYPFYLAL